MAAIICELCGASELIKEGDFFVCKSCGTKYSLQEAKKLLGESNGNNSGVNLKSPIANYLVIAKNAVKVKNFPEAELYCNKVLEVNPADSDAWLNKGIAAGWLSNVQYFRLDEAINCFSNAIEFASSDSKDSVRKVALENLQQATINNLNAYYSLYFQAPRINAQLTLNFIDILTTSIFPYIDEKSNDGEDYSSPIALSILNVADGTIKDVWKRYSYRHMCKYEEERQAIVYDYMFAAEYFVYIVDKYINLKCVSLQQKVSALEGIINTCTAYLENGVLRKDDFWKGLIAKYSGLLHDLSPSAPIEKTVKPKVKKSVPKPKKPKTENKDEEGTVNKAEVKKPKAAKEPEVIYWENVIVTDSEKDVAKLKFDIAITKSSWWGGVATDYGVKRAIQKIQKAAAKRGCRAAYITDIDVSFWPTVTAWLYKKK